MPRLPTIFRDRPASLPDLRRFLRSGDEANRRRSWRDAESAYRAALAIDASLTHIWVQYGHALKEQGNFGEAERAYRKSLALDGGAADTHLQLGHVLKLQGRVDEAADAYLTAYRRDPVLPYPRIELEVLGIEIPSARTGTRTVSQEPSENAEPEPEQILAAHGLSPEVARFFDFRYYFYVNPLVQEALDRPDLRRCLSHFATQGVEAGLACSPRHAFDTDFYGETYLQRHLSEANAYWHWLSVGVGKGWHPNRNNWLCEALGAENLTTAGLDFDACRKFFYEDRPKARWTELFKVFIDTDVLRPGPHLPVTPATADLFTAIADRFAVTGRNDDAALVYEQVLVSVPQHRRSLLNYGDCLRRKGISLNALSIYERAIALNIASKWCFLHQAACYQELGKLQIALTTLRQGLERFPGEQQLKAQFETLAQQFADREWQIAMATGKTGRYGEAQSSWEAACRFLVSLLPSGRLLASRRLESVAIVATLQMPQCKFYRVDQKIEHLEAAGYRWAVYDYSTELPKFIEEIRQHQAVIFYRVPGNFPVMNAINQAKAMGLVTFYDIDDFIFGGEDYPGTFESFLDQITLEEYVGLKLTVPWYRTTISLCDYGIASTPALADEMAKLVLSGQAFVHRNALGARQELLSMPAPRRRNRDRVTIFYGSGTKSHNEDFRDLVDPALAEIGRRYGNRVHIVLAGHIVVSPELAAMRENLSLIGPVWDVDCYWAVLRDADINVAVLKPDPMTHCKSEIKWLEAAMFGIPSVVSSTATYDEVIEPGVTGLVCRTVEEWIEALDRLVRDAELRHRIGLAAWDRVRDAYCVPRMAANLQSIFTRAMPAAVIDAKPTVVVVNVFYPPQPIGGATRIVYENVKHLTERYGDDFRIEVFTSVWSTEENLVPQSYVHDGIRVTTVSRTAAIEQMLADGGMAEVFGEFLDAIQPALVHFHCIQRLTTSVISATAGRGIPYLITAHDGWWISPVQFIVDEDDRPRLYDYTDPAASARQWGGDAYGRMMALRELLQGAVKVLTVSQKFAALYRSCGVANVAAIENGIGDIRKAPRTPSADGRVRLGFIGGKIYQKGYDLIRYALLSHAFERLRLVVVDGGLEPGDSRSEVWSTTPVDFIPKVQEDEVGTLYATLDVVLAPSVCVESFGLVSREALYCGCWVIASDRGGIGDCVTPGENGFVIDVASPHELVRVLKLIDADPARYRQPPPVVPTLRRSAEQAEELAELYQSIIDRPKLPAIAGIAGRIGPVADEPIAAGSDRIVELQLPQIYGGARFAMLNQQQRDLVVTTIAGGGWQEFERPMPEIFAGYASTNPGLVVDIGVNTGFYALLACRVHARNTVLGFEPDRQVRGALYENLALNRLEARVLVSPLALSDHVGEAQLYIPLQNHGLVESSSSLEASFKDEHSAVVGVGMSTLDAVLSAPRWRDDKVSIIKIDVEGHEHPVLRGAIGTIARWRPVIFVEVLERADCEALTGTMRELRYVDIPIGRAGLSIRREVQFDPDAWNHALVPAEQADDFLRCAQSEAMEAVG